MAFGKPLNKQVHEQDPRLKTSQTKQKAWMPCHTPVTLHRRDANTSNESDHSTSSRIPMKMMQTLRTNKNSGCIPPILIQKTITKHGDFSKDIKQTMEHREE